MKQAELSVAIALSVSADDIPHFIEKAAPVTGLPERLPERLGPRAAAFVGVAVPADIDVLQPPARKGLLQFVQLIGALILAQGHAEGGIDKAGPAFGRLPDDFQNIFLIVL